MQSGEDTIRSAQIVAGLTPCYNHSQWSGRQRLLLFLPKLHVHAHCHTCACTSLGSPALSEICGSHCPLSNLTCGRWDPDNTKLFPKTTRIIKKSNAPSLEVFFARQPGGTGIKPHTDNSNFIMTGHLALVVPEGNCWIKARAAL